MHNAPAAGKRTEALVMHSELGGSTGASYHVSVPDKDTKARKRTRAQVAEQYPRSTSDFITVHSGSCRPGYLAHARSRRSACQIWLGQTTSGQRPLCPRCRDAAQKYDEQRDRAIKVRP